MDDASATNQRFENGPMVSFVDEKALPFYGSPLLLVLELNRENRSALRAD